LRCFLNRSSDFKKKLWSKM